MEGMTSDKVNIHVGADGGGRGGDMAAVIAALGNRNEGNASLGPILAALGGRQRDDGFGGGGLGMIALLALLGRRGFGDGDGDHARDGMTPAGAALIQSIMQGVNGIAADVPRVALESQAEIQQTLGALALGTQQGLANVKDSVQASGTVNLVATKDVGTQVQTGVLQTVIAVTNDGDKTRALITELNTQNLQRELAVAQSALTEERGRRHSDGVEVRVSQTVTQAQAQAQQQAQFNNLFGALSNLANDLQLVRQGQTIFNSGTMAASGTQAAANTRVN